MWKTNGQQSVGQPVTNIVIGAFAEVVAGLKAQWTRRRNVALFAIPVRITRQQRPSIHAISLKRDPVRPDISLLENMNSYSVRCSKRMHMPMYFAAISEHDDVGSRTTRNPLLIPKGQIRTAPAKIVGRFAPAIDQIAAAEIDPLEGVTSIDQLRCKLTKKRRCRSLQCQKRTPHRMLDSRNAIRPLQAAGPHGGALVGAPPQSQARDEAYNTASEININGG